MQLVNYLKSGHSTNNLIVLSFKQKFMTNLAENTVTEVRSDGGTLHVVSMVVAD